MSVRVYIFCTEYCSFLLYKRFSGIIFFHEILTALCLFSIVYYFFFFYLYHFFCSFFLFRYRHFVYMTINLTFANYVFYRAVTRSLRTLIIACFRRKIKNKKNQREKQKTRYTSDIDFIYTYIEIKNQLRIDKIRYHHRISYENDLFTRPKSFFANGLIQPRLRSRFGKPARIFVFQFPFSLFPLFSFSSFSLFYFYFCDKSWTNRLTIIVEINSTLRERIRRVVVRPIKHTVAAKGNVSQRIKMHASLDAK